LVLHAELVECLGDEHSPELESARDDDTLKAGLGEVAFGEIFVSARDPLPSLDELKHRESVYGQPYTRGE
jgi:hypothetical protein